jgi:hypothetical protein
MLIFSVRAPKDLIDGSGECGYLCHYGVCSMNIRTFLLYDKSVVDKLFVGVVGCAQANAAIIRANNHVPACSPAIACADFAEPCRGKTQKHTQLYILPTDTLY